MAGPLEINTDQDIYWNLRYPTWGAQEPEGFFKLRFTLKKSEVRINMRLQIKEFRNSKRQD